MQTVTELVPVTVCRELFDEYIWAASVMARKEGNFVIDCNIPEIPGSVIAGNLGAVPEIIEEDGEE